MSQPAISNDKRPALAFDNEQEADALIDAGKIQSGNTAIHQLDPSLSKP